MFPSEFLFLYFIFHSSLYFKNDFLDDLTKITIQSWHKQPLALKKKWCWMLWPFYHHHRPESFPAKKNMIFKTILNHLLLFQIYKYLVFIYYFSKLVDRFLVLTSDNGITVLGECPSQQKALGVRMLTLVGWKQTFKKQYCY